MTELCADLSVKAVRQNCLLMSVWQEAVSCEDF